MCIIGPLPLLTYRSKVVPRYAIKTYNLLLRLTSMKGVNALFKEVRLHTMLDCLIVFGQALDSSVYEVG